MVYTKWLLSKILFFSSFLSVDWFLQVDKKKPLSSSETRSLGMEKLLEQIEQPKPKSNFGLDDFWNADPSNRWVKRLKLSSSNSSDQERKSPNFVSPHEKMSMLFGGRSNSAPTKRNQHGRKSVLLDKSRDASMKDGDHMIKNAKDEGRALLLSHAWIQRWLHNKRRINKKKHETEIICELISSELALEKLRKEQFPSLAAMALMGKAFTCFLQCELQKRGSFTVWNTKTF